MLFILHSCCHLNDSCNHPSIYCCLDSRLMTCLYSILGNIYYCLFTYRGTRLNDPLAYKWHITLSLSSCRGVCMLATHTKVSASLPWMDSWWRHRVAAVCTLTLLVSWLYQCLFSLLICILHQLNALWTKLILVDSSFYSLSCQAYEPLFLSPTLMTPNQSLVLYLCSTTIELHIVW